MIASFVIFFCLNFLSFLAWHLKLVKWKCTVPSWQRWCYQSWQGKCLQLFSSRFPLGYQCKEAYYKVELALLLSLKHIKLILASEPLHFLFPMHVVPSSQYFKYMSSSPSLVHSSNIASSEKLSLTILTKIASLCSAFLCPLIVFTFFDRYV